MRGEGQKRTPAAKEAQETAFLAGVGWLLQRKFRAIYSQTHSPDSAGVKRHSENASTAFPYCRRAADRLS